MATWKELGEVPDSEDEGDFESQDLNDPQTQVVTTLTSLTDFYQGRDIWDLPSSQEAETPRSRHREEAQVTAETTKASTTKAVLEDSTPGRDIWEFPGSSLSEEIRDDDEDDLARSPTPKPLRTSIPLTTFSQSDSPLTTAPPSPQSLSPSRYSLSEDTNVPPTLKQGFDSATVPSAPSPCELSTVSRSPEKSKEGERLSSSKEAEVGERHEARQIAIRHERSLRPRKPIQEHPYLLENVQYSTFLRRHGVKPLRIASEGVAPIEHAEGSQDADFEQESQDKASLTEETDESQQRSDIDASKVSHALLLSSSPPATSPPGNLGEPSSLPTSQLSQDTFDTDEDLPDIDQLLKSRPHMNPPSLKFGKRRTSQPPLTTRKRQRQDVIPNCVESGSPDPLAGVSSHEEPSLTPTRSDHVAGDEEPDTPLAQLLDPPPRFQIPIPVIDISSEDEESGSEVEASANTETFASPSASEGEELVTKIGRRIRGVLPASWLRLDQQSSRDKAQREIHRKQQQRGLDRETRRGVAQRRQAVPGYSSGQAQIIFEDSDEEEEERRGQTRRPDPGIRAGDISYYQTRLSIEPIADEVAPELSSDGASSVIEVDSIDHMMPGRKRQMRLPTAFEKGKKRRRKTETQNFRLSSKKPKPNQLRITSLLPRPSSRKAIRTSSKSKSGGHGQGTVASPSLSILDVMQQNAPRFIRIAARAARRRTNQGRSRVYGKSIKLATRQDNVDAATVLEEWRNGMVKQRPAITAACRSQQPKLPKLCAARKSQPLSDTSASRSTPHFLQVVTRKNLRQPRKFERQISQGGSPSLKRALSSIWGQTSATNTAQIPGICSRRPAQLEIAELESRRILKFSALKRVLDRSYRKRARSRSVTGSVRSLERALDNQSTVNPGHALTEQPHVMTGIPGFQSNAPRCRKRTKPCRVNVDAPQYLFADDPLPTTSLSHLPTSPVQSGPKKLKGLGPYGTKYTHHFEIFPLDTGVFFHESTLLGSGIIDVCLQKALTPRLCHPGPRIHFRLGEQVLKWGPWDDQTSSELGIVLDFVAEELESNESMREPRSSAGSNAIGAASFVLEYVTEALSADEGPLFLSVVPRFHKVLSSFCERVDAQAQQWDNGQQVKSHTALKIFDRLLLVSFFLHTSCQSKASRSQQQMQTEEMLKVMARATLTLLERSGFSQLINVYNDLSSASRRERGLRDDAPAIHSCTLLMKILEVARIPQLTFWDLVEGVIDLPQTLSSLDSRRHEHVWKTIFTLLPLSEFNKCGIIGSGARQQMAVNGWAIPQKLLMSVFEIYRANERQAPSFNNYCCALVGRCHYLLQQWGWHRGAPIIGVIFDFFGAQSFAHLRNEEVYASPRFLEELAKGPSLDLEPNDRCFHVFLKLLALCIRELKNAGLERDIRNLVARTIPNHNRQFLKEQNPHERDLAALRNQHDLIVTLYWACPLKMRPSAALLERLVAPETSHKEACMINIRAWSQLARFVVTSGEATTLPKHLGSWRNNFFLKTLQVFESVASEIQQQFSCLSKDVSASVSKDMINEMIATNKAVAKDVLFASLAASLDVMKHAPDLEAASFCFSSPQLQHVFRSFTVSPPEFDWAMLRTALSILDTFLSKIEDFKDGEGSQQNESQVLTSAQADDALMAIDHDLSRIFFHMTRSIISMQSETKVTNAADSDRLWCVIEAVALSARLGVRFINGCILRVSDMFKAGKYGVFNSLPRSLDLSQRRYLPLFLCNLLKQGLSEFSDAGFGLAEAWMLSLVKPQEYLGYEYQLAEQLHQHQKGFVPDAVAGLGIRPDYSSNRDLFEYGVSWNRKGIREARPSLKKVLAREYSTILEAVMARMKADLHMIWQNASEHHAYVVFVRDVISLIKVHGSEFCTIDNFFYKVSREYSPSKQDPQLHVAGMISCGLRLQEGDMKVAHQLFYLLLNNFKAAMASDKLDDDVKMLAKGMRHQGIFSFVLGNMFPAILRASFSTDHGFILMEVYLEALRRHMRRHVVADEFHEGDFIHMDTILRTVMNGVDPILNNANTIDPLLEPQLHLVKQSFALINLLWPSIFEFCIANPQAESWKNAVSRLRRLGTFASDWSAELSEVIKKDGGSVNTWLGPVSRPSDGPPQYDAFVNAFAKDIMDDIARNWVCENSRITVQAPGPSRGTQRSEQGVKLPAWDARELVRGLFEELRECSDWASRLSGAIESSEAFEDLELT